MYIYIYRKREREAEPSFITVQVCSQLLLPLRQRGGRPYHHCVSFVSSRYLGVGTHCPLSSFCFYNGRSAPNYCYRCGNVAAILTISIDGAIDFQVFEPRPQHLRKVPDFTTRMPDYFL